jgi:hypothetical protein
MELFSADGVDVVRDNIWISITYKYRNTLDLAAYIITAKE